MTLRRLRFLVGTCVGLITAYGCNPVPPSASERGVSERLNQSETIAKAARAITELDVAQAQRMLSGLVSHEPVVPLLRAQLAIALGDCAGATGIFSSVASPTRGASELERVAENCARAMAGAEVVIDETRQVWVRLQNSRDRVLVPLIADVADRAALAIGQHLNTRLPRPLRIELVSDLVSLSHLTGLPLTAAETTGTVAIARFGKVTMLSPRATNDGYPWQDTLAHEIAHLAVTRVTSDEAPLWLQEGIAKREETAWRSARPLDDPDAARRLSRRALAEGRFIGLEQLGASIALLPSPQAAATAYAEVESFYGFLRGRVGEPGIRLFLTDLRSLGGRSVESALRSVTGYGFAEWVRLFQRDLLTPASDEPNVARAQDEPASMVSAHELERIRRLRVGVLLSGQRHWSTAADVLALAASEGVASPELRWRWALAESQLGRFSAATNAIGTIDTLRYLDGAWLARYGRIQEHAGQLKAAEAAFELGLSFAPTLERVACRGEARADDRADLGTAFLPTIEPFRSLCLDAIGTSGL